MPESQVSSPAPGWPPWLCRGVARCYGLAVAAHAWRYREGRGVQRLPLPVLSVGNLTAGGTGKTPVVAWLTRWLAEETRRPVIATRGYAARRGEEADEVRELREVLSDVTPPVPMLVGADRAESVRRFLAEGNEASVVVLDDGFQHRKLARDVDLVLIDAQRPSLNDALLPAGWLREPAEALQRATAVMVTRAEAPDTALSDAIERLSGRPPIAWSAHRWTHLRRIEMDGSESRADLSLLNGLPISICLGIGHAAAMERQLQVAGADIRSRAPVRDHQRYEEGMLREVLCAQNGAKAIVTTAKDLVKIHPLLRDRAVALPAPLLVPVLTLDVHHGADQLKSMIRSAIGGG